MRHREIAATIVAILLVIPACGGGSSKPAAAKTTTTAPGSQATTTIPTTTTTGDPVIQAAVSKAVETALNTSSGASADAVAGLIEDGDTPAIKNVVTAEAAAGAGANRAISTKVTTVQALDQAGCTDAAMKSPCAVVHYDLYTSATPTGTPALANAQLYAVNVGGTWKISRSSFCSLLALGPEPHCPNP
ncbi:MAG: hypothetical protein QOG64_3042 [Acidimicrobiaceae bacterium]|nr:hypothetical protein [Acidimicrobiaceae bacterium]